MKLFKKKETQLTEVIEAIHGEFNSAGDKLYNEAMSFLQQTNVPNLDKVERLKRLGFTSSKEVKVASKILEEKRQREILTERIMKYKVKYPFYKFITEEQVKDICKKYGLIYGKIGDYKGFIPEKNLSEIETFSIEEEDMGSSDYPSAIDKIYRYAVGVDAWRPMDWRDYAEVVSQMTVTPTKVRVIDFFIAGSPKDFNTSNMEVKNYKLQHIPDPVVLAKVVGGYFIVTAWGIESHDPIVKNEINN